MPSTVAHDAFISYSHRVGGRLGPALRDALHDFGKRWYRLRNMRVFCDRSSVTPNESLWEAIASALQGSATFVLLASTAGGRSPWVQREVRTWQAQRPRRPLFIVVTDGEVVWDDDAGDFDWQRTTAGEPARLVPRRTVVVRPASGRRRRAPVRDVGPPVPGRRRHHRRGGEGTPEGRAHR